MVDLSKTFYILSFCPKKSNAIKALCISLPFPGCRTKASSKKASLLSLRKILQYLPIMLRKKKSKLIFITYKALHGLTLTYFSVE